jgi:hypothetical protein
MKGKFVKANYVFVTRLLPNPPLCGSTLLKVLIWVTDFLKERSRKERGEREDIIKWVQRFGDPTAYSFISFNCIRSPTLPEPRTYVHYRFSIISARPARCRIAETTAL